MQAQLSSAYQERGKLYDASNNLENAFREVIKRKPQTLVQAIEIGIPGLRQCVREKQEKVRGFRRSVRRLQELPAFLSD